MPAIHRWGRASCGLRNVGLRHAQAVPAGRPSSPDAAALRPEVRDTARRVSGRSPAADHLADAGGGVFAARPTARPGNHHPERYHGRRCAGGLLVRREELRRQSAPWREPRLESSRAGLIHGTGRRRPGPSRLSTDRVGGGAVRGVCSGERCFRTRGSRRKRRPLIFSGCRALRHHHSRGTGTVGALE